MTSSHNTSLTNRSDQKEENLPDQTTNKPNPESVDNILLTNNIPNPNQLTLNNNNAMPQQHTQWRNGPQVVPNDGDNPLQFGNVESRPNNTPPLTRLRPAAGDGPQDIPIIPSSANGNIFPPPLLNQNDNQDNARIHDTDPFDSGNNEEPTGDGNTTTDDLRNVLGKLGDIG